MPDICLTPGWLLSLLIILANQLDSSTLHRIVYVDIGLCCGDAFVASQGSKDSDPDAFARQRRDDAASAGMTGRSITASTPIDRHTTSRSLKAPDPNRPIREADVNALIYHTRRLS